MPAAALATTESCTETSKILTFKRIDGYNSHSSFDQMKLELEIEIEIFIVGSFIMIA